jgi:penicillin-binding protein 1A
VIGLIASVSLLAQAPELPKLPPIKREPQVTYLDRTGAVIGVRGGKAAPPIDVARLPAYVPAAFVSIEDKRFYEHSGFDVAGIARAVLADVSKGRAAQGASTITQQLARDLFLTNTKTVERKATELVYAIELEQTYSKQQILGLYLSRANFGSGAWGLEAAAQRYFDKPAAKLTIREAAMLAAVMKSPTNYNPVADPDKNAERTRLVLDAMLETGAISPAQHDQALAQEPKVWKVAADNPAQYFVDWLDAQARQVIGTPRQDMVVETTLDLALEDAAASSLKTTIAAHKAQGIGQGALISLDGAGGVRAFVGGTDYVTAPFDRAADAHRQAGSAWKPFVYLTALEQGRTPDTMVVDEPVTIDGWTPHNFEDGVYLGQITMEKALAESINTVAARMADEIGRPNVAATAHRLGISTEINTDPAMALGTSLVTPLEMAEAYTAFANGGALVKAWGVQRIRTAGGQVVWQRQRGIQPQVINNPQLGQLLQMMHSVVAYGTGVNAGIKGYDIAGKTGTTSDYKDAWFCGFSGDFSTIVWMGRDDDKPMRKITGGMAPAEAWRSYMTYALKRVKAGAIPPGPPPPIQAPAAIPASEPGAPGQPAPTPTPATVTPASAPQR